MTAGLAPFLAATAVGVLALETFFPGASPLARVAVLAIAGAVLGASPLPLRLVRAAWRSALAGALLLPPAVLLLRAALRAVGGGALPAGTVPGLLGAVVLVLLLVDRGALPRLVRLAGVEAFKTRRATLFRAGLLAAAALTLLAGLVHARPPMATGWSVLATTLDTGFATAEIFLLVLGATALAGEATAGTLKMMLPRAFRRGDWVTAKAVVLLLAALAFAAAVLGTGLVYAGTTEGLGDVVQTLEPLFPGDTPAEEVFATADTMRGHVADRVLLAFAALATTALLGLACSALFDGVTAALCFAFLLFAGLKFADLFLGLPRAIVERLYPWYPEQVGVLLEKLGRALNERWDDALLPAGLAVAATSAAVLLLLALSLFARRDVQG